MAKIYRFFRLLEYTGNAKFINESMDDRTVKEDDFYVYGSDNTIKEIILSDITEQITTPLPEENLDDVPF